MNTEKIRWFQDDVGSSSSMRIVTVVVLLTFMAVWAIISIRQGLLQPLDFGDAAFVGVFIGGKVAQKAFEIKEANREGGGPK
jgi:predicted transporter